jgi:hypothetical protein
LVTKIFNFFPPPPPIELINFKRKRVAAFRKNLIEMSELEIKHARVSVFYTSLSENFIKQ